MERTVMLEAPKRCSFDHGTALFLTYRPASLDVCVCITSLAPATVCDCTFMRPLFMVAQDTVAFLLFSPHPLVLHHYGPCLRRLVVRLDE